MPFYVNIDPDPDPDPGIFSEILPLRDRDIVQWHGVCAVSESFQLTIL